MNYWWIVFVFVAFVSSLAKADFLTVLELKNACSSDASREIGHCEAFIYAVTNTYLETMLQSNKPSELCFKGDESLFQNIAIFELWADHNPNKWNMPAHIGVFHALKQAYPCDMKK